MRIYFKNFLQLVRKLMMSSFYTLLQLTHYHEIIFDNPRCCFAVVLIDTNKKKKYPCTSLNVRFIKFIIFAQNHTEINRIQINCELHFKKKRAV